jgi:hypothetical protein
MYSRFITVKTLSMAAHPVFNARRTDPVEEDLVEGRLDLLESLHHRPRVDEPAQEVLRIRPLGQLDLEEAVRIVDAPDESIVRQHRGDAIGRAPIEA